MLKIDKIPKEFIIKALTEKQIKDIEINYFFKWFFEINKRVCLKDCINKFNKILSSTGVNITKRNLSYRFYEMKRNGLVKGRYNK